MSTRSNPKLKREIKETETLIIQNLDQGHDQLRKDSVEEICAETIEEFRDEAEKFIGIHENLVKLGKQQLTEYDHNRFNKRNKTFKKELEYIKGKIEIFCKSS